MAQRKTFFNEIFSDLTDDIKIIQLQDYMNQYIQAKKKNESDFFMREGSGDLLGRYQKVADSVTQYPTRSIPDRNELRILLEMVKKYLEDEHMLSGLIMVESLQIRLNKLIDKVNYELVFQGDKPIKPQKGWDSIEAILSYAHSLSFLPTNKVKFPRQYFDPKNFNGSRYFIGRINLMNDIGSSIFSGKSVYLQGMGGIGKTEIVRTVVKKIANVSVLRPSKPITDILWIDLHNDKCGEFTSLDDDIKQQVCQALHPKSITDNLENEYKDCLNELKGMGEGLLIVVDNIEVCNDDLRAFCNCFDEARFLLVGRPNSLGLAITNLQTIKVEALNLEVCETLFKNWYFDGVATVGQGLSKEDENDAKEIIELADRHTVTVELFAKLIRKQDFYEAKGGKNSPIHIFLETLKTCGFNLKFQDETGEMYEEEPVSAEHHLMKKERRIIEQLSMLFSTMQLTDSSKKELLIKISTIPNLPFEFREIKKWFSLKNKVLLEKLSEDGWLQRNDGAVTTYCMHSVIAAALRHENAGILHKTCQKFILSMGKSLLKTRYPHESQKLLIQFSWSVADIFGDDITKMDDEFFRALIAMYRKLHLDNKANFLYGKLREAPWYSIN